MHAFSNIITDELMAVVCSFPVHFLYVVISKGMNDISLIRTDSTQFFKVAFKKLCANCFEKAQVMLIVI